MVDAVECPDCERVRPASMDQCSACGAELPEDSTDSATTTESALEDWT